MFNKRQEKKRLSFFLVDFKSYAKKQKETSESLSPKKPSIDPLYLITRKNLYKHNATNDSVNSHTISLVLNPLS